MTNIWVGDTVGRQDLPIWTRSYAAEILPGPVLPLDYDILLLTAAGPAWRAELVGRLGFRPNEVPTEGPPLIAVINGYAYLNASLLRVWAVRTPALGPNHIDAAYLGPDLSPFEPAPWHDHPAATSGSLNGWLRWVMVERDQSALQEIASEVVKLRASRPEFSTMLDDEVHARIKEVIPMVGRLMAHHLHQMLGASVGPGIIAAICAERGLPTEAVRLIAGLGHVDSAAPAHALWTLSRLVAHSATVADQFDEGLDGLEGRLRASKSSDVTGLIAGADALANETGRLGSASWELSPPPQGSATEQVLRALSWLRACPDEADPRPIMAEVVNRRAELLAEISDVDTTGVDLLSREQFLVAVKATEVFVRGREYVSRAMTMALDEIRVALWELGLRAANRNDVSHPGDLRLLFSDELGYYADGGLASVGDLVADRRQRLAEVARQTPPAMVDVRHQAQRLFPLGEPSPLEAGGIVIGRPVSSAVGRGRARIIIDPADLADLEPGDVVVASHAPTSWLPYLLGASAVITETGSLLGHLSILCRELGKPLVVGVEAAITRFTQNSVVEVDGLTGIVSVIEDPPHLEMPNTVVTLDPWGVN